ncbi:MAG: hypothetical protein OMM_07932, partial [Candidatus Magnetoglobus multicellularis str. Araruama]
QSNIQLIIDIDSMKFGDDIQGFIERSVQSSDITLSVISENSLASPWVMLETLETFQQEDALKTLRFIPVVIDQSYQSANFATQLIDHIEKSIDLIVDEISRLSKKYMATDSLDLQKKRLVTLRSNIDLILLNLSQRFVADFSTNEKYQINFSRLLKSIQQNL